MRVSVVTPSLNRVNTIRDTIQSVLNQDYNDIKYVIVSNSFLIGLVMIGLGFIGIYIGNIHDEVALYYRR